ncbi:MAG: fructosamine kinase family protein [Oscillospiraceae bacterium]|jgi:fructosamine-3-kinase|nr:fructosamine kinase family protein [Oscillospiraceae bacterium]
MFTLDNNVLIPQLPKIAELCLGESAQILRCLGGGSFGRAYLTQTQSHGKIVIKAYRVPGMNDAEAFQLELLGKNTRVPMPKALFAHTDDTACVLGMSYIEGKNTMMPQFLFHSKKKRKVFAASVVAGMLDWHAVTGEKYGDLREPKYSSWKEFYHTEIVNTVLEGMKPLMEQGKFSRKQYDTLICATERFDEIVDEPSEPVLIHGDLNIANIMADPHSLCLTGFIDPFNSLWADREYDLFQIQNMWGNWFGLYEEYKRRHPVTPHCDLKTAYYAAVNEALAYWRSGVKFESWHKLWDSRLRKALAQM